jgi:hypothetical protein
VLTVAEVEPQEVAAVADTVVAEVADKTIVKQ